MITGAEMATLRRGSRLRDDGGLLWIVLAARDRDYRIAGGPPPGGEIWHIARHTLSAGMSIERVSRGQYRHYKGDTYFVVGVGTLDADGHGNATAPRQVVYESTRSVVDGLLRLRSESDFLELVEWPETPGLPRPRFERIDP